MNLSSKKMNPPGRKQVFRVIEGGRMIRDVIAQHDETLTGDALLQPVMRNGRRLDAGRVPLSKAREHARSQLERLPPKLKALERVEEGYPVEISAALQETTQQLQRELGQKMTS